MAKLAISKFLFFEDHSNRFGDTGESDTECVCNADENIIGDCLYKDAIYYSDEFNDIWNEGFGGMILSARRLAKRIIDDEVQLTAVEDVCRDRAAKEALEYSKK